MATGWCRLGLWLGILLWQGYSKLFRIWHSIHGVLLQCGKWTAMLWTGHVISEFLFNPRWSSLVFSIDGGWQMPCGPWDDYLFTTGWLQWDVGEISTALWHGKALLSSCCRCIGCIQSVYWRDPLCGGRKVRTLGPAAWYKSSNWWNLLDGCTSTREVPGRTNWTEWWTHLQDESCLQHHCWSRRLLRRVSESKLASWNGRKCGNGREWLADQSLCCLADCWG